VQTFKYFPPPAVLTVKYMPLYAVVAMGALVSLKSLHPKNNLRLLSALRR